jgi:predicted TIM-barrel fold metal-dependent hydrolase
VNVSNPRRIDVHFHAIPPFYADAVSQAGSGPAIGRYPEWSPQLALEIMDRFKIETALTSLAQPGVQFCPPGEARVLAQRCNDYCADLTAKWPKRFGTFGTVSMWDVRDAVAEIERTLDQMKFAGISLFASYDGRFLGDPAFDPVMEALNARDAVVFVHPGTHPTNKLIQLPWPGFMMEYLFDTTRAVVNLVFGGALERYPRIRFILPHAGGLIPYFSWRLSVSPMIDKRLNQMSQDRVFELLRRFWYDNALSPGEQTWGCLETVASPDRIVFGTDWPFANARVTDLAMETYEGLDAVSPSQRDAIDRGNALKLFPQYA